MDKKYKVIAYISLIQNVTKAFVGGGVYSSKLHSAVFIPHDLKKARGVESYGDFFGIFTIAAFIGIFCSTMLLQGIRESSSMKILWWVVFQLISIAFQIAISIISVEIIKESGGSKLLENSAIVFFMALIVIEIHFYYLNTILYRKLEGNEAMRNEPEENEPETERSPPSYTQVLEMEQLAPFIKIEPTMDDKLPTFDEVMRASLV